MPHCHSPEGEWSVTFDCQLWQNAVFVHIAPTEGEDMEGRREWGVSPHTAKGKIATHWTLEEGRGDITGGERHEHRHSIYVYRLQTKSSLVN